MPRPDLTYAFIASTLIHLSLAFIVAYWVTLPKLLKEKALPSPPVIARRNPPLVGAGGTGTGTEAVHLSPLGGGRQETREAGGPDEALQGRGPAWQDGENGR